MRVGPDFPIRKQRAAKRAIRPYGGVDYHPPKVVSKPVRTPRPASRMGGGPSHSLMPKVSVPHFRRPLEAASVGAAMQASPRKLARAHVNPDRLYALENQMNASRIARRQAFKQYRSLIGDQEMLNSQRRAYKATRPHPVTLHQDIEGIKGAPHAFAQFGKALGQELEPTSIRKLREGKTPSAKDVGLDAFFFLPWSRGLRAAGESALAFREAEGAAGAYQAGLKSYRAGRGLGSGILDVASRARGSERVLRRMESRKVLWKWLTTHPDFSPAEARAQMKIFDEAARGTGNPEQFYRSIKVKIHQANIAPGDLKGLYQHVPPSDVPRMPDRLKVKGLPHRVYKLIQEGAPYRDWYKRAARVLTDAAHRLDVTPEQMAGVTAVMSQQANPTFNLRRAVEAIQEFKTTGRIEPSKYFSGQAEKATAILNGTFDWSGLKTSSYFGNFLQHMNPELHGQLFSHQPVTIDRHMADMMFGTKKVGEARYLHAQRVFQDAAKQLGWEPHEVQAAAWVPWKARALQESTAVKALGKELMKNGEVPERYLPTEGMSSRERLKLQKARAKWTRQQYEAGRRAEGFSVGPLEQYYGTAADAYERGQHLYRGELYQRPYREHTFSPSVAQVHSEANPDGELHSVLREAYDKLPLHEQTMYDRLVNKAVDGQFEDILGLNKIGLHEGPGIWRGKATEGIASHLEVGPGQISPEDQNKIEALAAAQGIVKHQNSVAWGRPRAEGYGQFAGIHWDPVGQDAAHLSDVMDTVAGAGNVGFVHAPDGGFYVIDFAGGNDVPIKNLGGHQTPIGWDGGYVTGVPGGDGYGVPYQEAIDRLTPDVRGRLLHKINQVKAQVDQLDAHFLKVPVPQVTDLAGAKALAEQGGYTFHGTSPMNAEAVMAERTLRAGGSDPEAAWTTTNPEMANFYARGGNRTSGPGDIYQREEGNIVALPQHAIPGWKEGPFGVHGHEGDIHFQRGSEDAFRGAYENKGVDTAILHLTKSANVTTLPHELGHALEHLGLTPEMRSTVEDVIGPLDSEAAHETFAQMFEAHILRGDNKNLKAEFEALRPAFKRAYPHDGNLPVVPPEIEQVFNHLLNQKDGFASVAYYLLRNAVVKRSLMTGPGAARDDTEAKTHLDAVAAHYRAKGKGMVGSDIPKVPSGETSEETGGQLGKMVREALSGKVDTTDMGVYEATGAKMDAGISSARARAERKEGYSAARTEKVGRAYGAQEGLSGFDRYVAMSKELKGELPSDAWRNMQGPVADHVNEILDFILDHPGLQLYEKKSAADAIMQGIELGRAPTQSGEQALRKVFGREMSNSIKDLIKSKDYGRLLLEVSSIPRAIMASFDFGAGLRQGIMFGVSRPELFRSVYGKQFKMVFEKNYDALNQAIHSDPYFPIYDQMGIQFTEVGHKGELIPLDHREEYFASNLAEALIPGIKASDRLYTGFLNMARWQYAHFMLEMGSSLGFDMSDEKILHDMGEYINAATGRGPLKRLQKAAPVLNATLFSPRLLMSRIAFLNPWWYMQMHPLVRREALRAARNFVTLIGGIGFMAHMAGARVSLDPTNADFAKIRIGNTRIDPTAGFTQEVRLMAQMISGEVTSSVTGRREKLSGKAFAVGRMDVLQRWLRTKTNPVAGMIWDMLKGSDTLGQPISFKREVQNYLVPLVIQDFMNTFGQHHNAGAGAAALALSEAGVGVQTYGSPKATASEALKKLVSDSQAAGLPAPPPAVKADVEWQNRLDNAIYAGEPAHEKAAAAAKIYDERFNTKQAENILSHLQNEGEAERLYLQIRSHIAPHLQQWNTVLNRAKQRQQDRQPVPSSAPASGPQAAPAPTPAMAQTAYHVPIQDTRHPIHARFLAAHSTAPSGASAYIAAAARQRGLDPEAVLAVASQEGLGGGVGDSGSSFGPFQLHAGGALPSEVWAKGAQYAAAWAWSPAGIHYALDRIASVARGLHGQAAVQAIVTQFERPASPGQEVAGAMSAYGHAPGAGHGIGGGGFEPQGLSVGLGIPGSPAADAGLNIQAVDQQGLLDLASGHYDPSVQILHLFRAASSRPIKPSITTAGGQTIHFELPPGGGKTARGAIALAQHFLGTPYVWGGDRPGGFDCSGLLYYVWAQQGVHIPRTSQQQWRAGTPVKRGQLRPGDAVFFEPTASGPGHVGMYIGHGQFIEAPHTGATVRVSRLRGYPGYMGARRFTGRRA